MNSGREWAAVFIASVIVISYIAIGFATAFMSAIAGIDIKFPPDWSSAMLSLVSTAFGFLISKFVGSTNGNGVGQSAVVENAENVNVAAPKPTVNPVATRATEGIPGPKQ